MGSRRRYGVEILPPAANQDQKQRNRTKTSLFEPSGKRPLPQIRFHDIGIISPKQSFR